MEEEKEITDADVKSQFDQLEKPTEATEESSAPEKEVSESTSEVVKPVTEEVVGENEEKFVPYPRFKEVNDKVKEFEKLQEEVSSLVERGPDGRLRLKVQETKEPEYDGLKLTDEEQLALDSVQTSVVSKLVQRELAIRERQAENTRLYREESSKWWNKAKEEFPEVSKPNSEFYKRADKIFRDQYVTFSKDGKQWTASPNSHYLSCLQAEKELLREKAKTTQVKIEEKKNQKQSVFVEKKASQEVPKKKSTVKDFEEASYSEQEELLREQFEESQKALDE